MHLWELFSPQLNPFYSSDAFLHQVRILHEGIENFAGEVVDDQHEETSLEIEIWVGLATVENVIHQKIGYIRLDVEARFRVLHFLKITNSGFLCY